LGSTAKAAVRDSENTNELLSRVTQGLDSPNSPRDSEIINELLSRVTHGFNSPNSRRDSEIINELLSHVTNGFDSPHVPWGLRNNQRNGVTSDAWI
jgi:hypothetical protein